MGCFGRPEFHILQEIVASNFAKEVLFELNCLFNADLRAHGVIFCAVLRTVQSPLRNDRDPPGKCEELRCFDIFTKCGSLESGTYWDQRVGTENSAKSGALGTQRKNSERRS